MTVHFIWRASSSMPDRQDAFWVACSAAEVDAIIVPVLSEDERTSFEHQRESLCSDGFARANPSLALHQTSGQSTVRESTACEFPGSPRGCISSCELS